MKRMNLPLMSKRLAGAALLVGWLTASALAQSPNHGIAEPAQVQNPPPVRVGGVVITGIPEDWSDRHVVFSDPGTEQEAIWNGRHAQWQRIVNNPRYVMQQMRKNLPVRGPAAADVEARSKSTPGGSTPLNEGAWAVSLNGPGLAAGHYPAKYSLSTTAAAGCRDFVVFPTGAPGSGGGTTPTTGQATIVAFYNLYVGGCPTGGNPVAYWAYNTGGTANLSPVLSEDGRQVAFIQSVAGSPRLVLLKVAACTGCSVTQPITPTLAASAAAYSTCLAPCYYQVSIGGNDGNEAPFYRYDNDTLYVTNDQGQAEIISSAFKGIPAVTGPVNIGAQPVTSPVYDFATGRLFVKTGGGTLVGVLAQVNGSDARASSQLECNPNGFRDAPVVDSSLGLIYAFIGYGCDASHNSFINRFVTSSFNSASPGPGTGTAFSLANGGANNPSTTIGTHDAFDNTYLRGGAGNLYGCVNGVVYRLSNPAGISGGGTTAVTTFVTLSGSGANSTAVCSPVTSFQDASGVDRIFVSVQANGNAGGCTTGSCVFSITIPGGTILGRPVVGGTGATGGTSGIIVDNSSTSLTGTQQIYFTTLGGTSNATQLSQSGLN